MLNSILQTLAEMLTNGAVLNSIEQIDFSHPANIENSNRDRSLNLYLYDVRNSKIMPSNGRQVERHFDKSRQIAEVSKAPSWFDVSIIITARDRTVLGENQLLSETLLLLMRSRLLREEFLTPDLRGHGDLSLSVVKEPLIDVGSLWSSLSVPIRPAIYLTVTVPFNVWRKTTVPLVTERSFKVNNSISDISRSEAKVQRVTIAGIVRNTLNSKPLRQVEIILQGTEKSSITNKEGYFIFENLTSGDYILDFRRIGYESKSCNVFVDGESCISKEISLMPFW